MGPVFYKTTVEKRETGIYPVLCVSNSRRIFPTPVPTLLSCPFIPSSLDIIRKVYKRSTHVIPGILSSTSNFDYCALLQVLNI